VIRSQGPRTAWLRAVHRIAHWTRHNYGAVETFWHEDTLMIGFRCNCGELLDVSPCRRIWE
jgi:hypothetical protein